MLDYNNSVDIRIVSSEESGIELAKTTLYEKCAKDTVLFLSGGETPKPLYKVLATEQRLKVGAVAMVDDRYSFHQQYSNEIMIKASGFLDFLDQQNSAFYPILEFGFSREKTATQYEDTVSFLLNHFPKNIAIMGIGEDGHTAGIPVGVPSSEMQIKNENYVAEFNSFLKEPKERVTLTFRALSMIDLLIVLAFGENKKAALERVFTSKDEAETPACFYNRPEVSKKTLLITDQKI